MRCTAVNSSPYLLGARQAGYNTVFAHLSADPLLAMFLWKLIAIVFWDAAPPSWGFCLAPHGIGLTRARPGRRSSLEGPWGGGGLKSLLCSWETMLVVWGPPAVVPDSHKSRESRLVLCGCLGVLVCCTILSYQFGHLHFRWDSIHCHLFCTSQFKRSFLVSISLSSLL